MKFIIISIMILFGFQYNSESQSSTVSPLKIGDRPPSLEIAKWLKGKPVLSFKKGQVYIVEMGFVACTPCRASIPHLTEISKKYNGKVTVIGVNIWENDTSNLSDLSYINRVDKYIKSMGDKIGYTVAVDVPEQTTANTWGGGAPKAFVIDQTGTVVWIGHPDGLDPVIDQVILNTFDPQGTIASHESENTKYIDEHFIQIWNNKSNRNYSAAIAGIDSLIHKYPEKTWLLEQKYRVLDGIDVGNYQANSFVLWLLNTKPKGFINMYYLSHEIIGSKYPDYDLAIEMADWALQISTYDFHSAFCVDAKALAYFKKGDILKAIETEKAAINYTQSYDDKRMTDAREILENKLKYYKKILTDSEWQK